MVLAMTSQLLASTRVPLAVRNIIGTRTGMRSFDRVDRQTGNFVGDGGAVGTAIRQGGGRVLITISEGRLAGRERKLPCGACFARDVHVRQHQLRQQSQLQ